MHGSYIPSVLKQDCTVTLAFGLEGQGHISMIICTYQNQPPIQSVFYDIS